MTLMIRPFNADDTEPVVRLWQRCELTVTWNDPYQDISRKCALQPELFLVGEKQSRLVASAMGGYDGHRGWIYYLAVDPDFRHRGYGRQIVVELENRLREAGCAKVNLMVRKGNGDVVEFYSTLGYRVDEVVSLGKRLITD